jgi:hypothetical protein
VNWPPSAPSKTNAPSRPPMREDDVTTLADRELEQVRRELAVSLALARSGSPVRGMILARVRAIDAELGQRTAAKLDAFPPLPLGP